MAQQSSKWPTIFLGCLAFAVLIAFFLVFGVVAYFRGGGPLEFWGGSTGGTCAGLTITDNRGNQQTIPDGGRGKVGVEMHLGVAHNDSKERHPGQDFIREVPGNRAGGAEDGFTYAWHDRSTDNHYNLSVQKQPVDSYENKIAFGAFGKPNPPDIEKMYINMRWDYNGNKDWYYGKPVLVKNVKSGAQTTAFIADWGPASGTGRVAGLSPEAAAAIDVKTDDEIEVCWPGAGAGVVPIEGHAYPIQRSRMTANFDHLGFGDDRCAGTGSGRPHLHGGVDLMHRAGEHVPLYAVVDGTIYSATNASIRLKPDPGINDPNGGYYYTHMSRSLVHAGQKVQAGQKIGESGGRSGGSIGDHLHFGVLKTIGGPVEIPVSSCSISGTARQQVIEQSNLKNPKPFLDAWKDTSN